MKKTIIITLIIITSLIVLVWWGSKSQNSNVSASLKTGDKTSLISSEIVYDFGVISMKNGKTIKDFIITNQTEKDIEISSINTSCMCTNAFIVLENGKTKGPFGMIGHGYVPPANQKIKAGNNMILRVIYDPNAHGPAGVGFIDRFITLTDEFGRELQLEIKATVTP